MKRRSLAKANRRGKQRTPRLCGQPRDFGNDSHPRHRGRRRNGCRTADPACRTSAGFRPRIETIGDAFAKRVVPSPLAAAIIVFLLTRDTRRALTMLLVACPGAAGLATPTAVSAAVGNSAHRGNPREGGPAPGSHGGAGHNMFRQNGYPDPEFARRLPRDLTVPSLRSEASAASCSARGNPFAASFATAIIFHARFHKNGNRRDEFDLVAGQGGRGRSTARKPYAHGAVRGSASCNPGHRGSGR